MNNDLIFPNPPKTIRVLGQVYRVIPIDIAVVDASTNNAWVDHNTLEIRIFDKLPKQKMAEVLMHEIVHAIYYAMDLEPGADEEAVVNCFARGLQCVASDNSEFWQWFLFHSRDYDIGN